MALAPASGAARAKTEARKTTTSRIPPNRGPSASASPSPGPSPANVASKAPDLFALPPGVALRWKAPDNPKEAGFVNGLALGDAPEGPVWRVGPDGVVRFFAKVKGKFSRKGWNLIWNEKNPVDPAPGGSFELEVEITGPATPIAFTGMGGLGETETKTVSIVFAGGESQWEEIATLARKGKSPEHPRFSLGAGLGPTLLSYRESPNDANLTDIAMTAKVLASFQLVRNIWDVGANTYVNLFNLSHKAGNAGSSRFPPARYAGFSGWTGLSVPFSGGWSVKTMVGYYLMMMMVPDKSYGINPLAGPNVFLMLRRFPPGKRGAWIYLKFAPLWMEKKSFANRELAGGGGFQLTHPTSRLSLALTIDVSKTDFFLLSARSRLSLFTASLGLNLAIDRLFRKL